MGNPPFVLRALLQGNISINLLKTKVQNNKESKSGLEGLGLFANSALGGTTITGWGSPVLLD